MLKCSTKWLTFSFSSIMLICVILLLPYASETKAQETKKVNETKEKLFPSVMSYEGYLTNSDGTPITDGNYDFTFSIYTEEAGGSPVWVEEHKSVPVDNGFIRLYLGRGTPPNPINLPFDTQYYVAISVGEAPEMTPRLELTSTGYSFRSKITDEVANESITTEKLAPHSVTDDKIKSVSWDKITNVPKGSLSELQNDKENPSGLDDQTHYIHSKGNIEMVIDRDNNSDDRTFSIRRDGLSRNNEGIELFRVQENDTVRINVVTKVADTTNSTSPFDGALVVDGGVGIAKDLNIGGTFSATTGSFERLEVIGEGYYGPKGANEHVALFENTSVNTGDGIAIKINRPSPYYLNNFVTFLSNGDNVVGRIEGQNLENLHDSWDFRWALILRGMSYGAYLAETVACLLNAPPDVAESIVNGIAAVITAVEWVRWTNNAEQNVGIAYLSGSGDYAEYLERLNVEEEIKAGDIVGVFGGKITKSTKDAQQFLVTSLSPIVLGNMPPESEEHLYEKIAFMGQVLVNVIGPVQEGDYIIPSGFEDGTGIAVSPEMMTADEYLKVVGRSWETSYNESLKLVNVVVGLISTDISSIVKRQMEENQQLATQLQTNIRELQNTRTELAELKKEVVNLSDLNRKVMMLEEAFENSELQKLTHTVNNVSESQ